MPKPRVKNTSQFQLRLFQSQVCEKHNSDTIRSSALHPVPSWNKPEILLKDQYHNTEQQLGCNCSITPSHLYYTRF